MADKQEAKAKGTNLDTSRKHCTELTNFIKGDSVEDAREKLQQVIDEERPVPYDTFNSDLSHRSGDIEAGRYPVNAAEEVLQVLESAASNAEYEGLASDDLYVAEAFATEGQRAATPKRNRGREPKSAHVTIKVREQHD